MINVDCQHGDNGLVVISNCDQGLVAMNNRDCALVVSNSAQRLVELNIGDQG